MLQHESQCIIYTNTRTWRHKKRKRRRINGRRNRSGYTYKSILNAYTVHTHTCVSSAECEHEKVSTGENDRSAYASRYYTICIRVYMNTTAAIATYEAILLVSVSFKCVYSYVCVCCCCCCLVNYIKTEYMYFRLYNIWMWLSHASHRPAKSRLW